MGHPASWRLHRAHAALGLEELEHDLLFAPKPYELGVAWLALPRDERARRERDFVAALHAAARPNSGFDVELALEAAPRVIGVHMDRWKAPALQRILLDHVWEAARQRDEAAARQARASRRDGRLRSMLRAHAQVNLSRLQERPVSTGVFAIAVAGLLGWHPFG